MKLFSDIFTATAQAAAEREMSRLGVSGGSYAAEAVKFTFRQAERMPGYLKPPFYFVLFLFSLSFLLKTGRRFTKARVSDRIVHLERWERSNSETLKSLAEFFFALTGFYVVSLHGKREK